MPNHKTNQTPRDTESQKYSQNLRELVMRFAYWSREIAGWALLVIGLMILWSSYSLFLQRRPFEAVPVMFMGFVVFRGGIHILKVAVAAQASRSLPTATQSLVRRTPKTTTRPVGPTPPKAVLPGPKSARPVSSSRS
jgi:hypothetical protein